ncbi:MAG: hypothetical protein JWO05_2336 [Gemmatimonadetes bacterium]|nr:hypothetical protein [Gemmatimonadota bacterium]
MLALPLALAAIVGISACSEQLESGQSCPSLCPQSQLVLRDTVIEAVDLDTTLVGLPTVGTEGFLLVASLGDTLDTRAIIRYDSLPTGFAKAAGAAETPITTVDSARVQFRIRTPVKPKAPVTIEVYDVDAPSVGPDTAAAPLLALFTPARLLGSRTFAVDSLVDSVRVPLDNAKLLAKITAKQRLRIGVKLVSSASAQLNIGTTQFSEQATVSFRATPDTLVARLVSTPLSRTPPDLEFLQGDLADYVIVAKASPLAGDRLSVGGAPTRRSYLRFDVPSSIVDSSTVVRATLQVTQAPLRFGPNAKDTISLYAQVVLANARVTEIGRQALFLSSVGQFGLDSLRLVPADSGLRQLEMVSLLRVWALSPITETPRAIVIRSSYETEEGIQIDFFSREAPKAVRPRLRITYAPRIPLALP